MFHRQLGEDPDLGRLRRRQLSRKARGLGHAPQNPSAHARLAGIVIARLLPLLLALCTLLPAELRARMLEACRERDDCECRRDSHAEPHTAPSLRRIDCCEAPCAIEGAASPTANTPRRDLADDAMLAARPLPTAAAPTSVASRDAPVLGRAPPRPSRPMTQRWLL